MIAPKLVTRLLITLSLVLMSMSLLAQPPAESKSQDSKKRASKLEMYRSSRSTPMIEEELDKTERLISKDPEAALDNVQELLATSIAQGDSFNEARSYQLLGDINAKIKEWKLAAQNYERAYSIYSTSYPTVAGFVNSQIGLAAAYMEAGNLEASFNSYNELLSHKLTIVQRQNAELALSEVYYRMNDYDRALKIVESIEPGNAKTKDQSFETRKQNQLAKIYAQKNNLSKTRQYLDNSLNVSAAEVEKDEVTEKSIQSTKEEVANVLRGQKRYDEEIAVRNQAIDYNLENNNLGAVTKDKVEISKSLEAKGENKAALKELLEAASIADTLDDPRDRATAYLSLAGLYERNGQNGNALNAYRKYSEAVGESEREQTSEMEQRSRIIKKQNDIDELSKELYIDRGEENVQKVVIQRQQGVIAGLILVIAIVFVTAFFIYRSDRSSKRANQLLALKSLRSQMNPHFIFNALNSVNHFIAQQDERTANKFLSEFSQLMRLVLEYSQEDFITLQKEQEILTLYMKLEHYRFRDKFDYEIDIDPSINSEMVHVPPMLIQPYIENAVWHGLRYRDEKGFLKMSMTHTSDGLQVTISDNGIGRKKSAELKTENQKKHRSTGLQNIKERLIILNRVYRTNYEVNVSDGENGVGTVVVVSLPFQNRPKA